MVGVVFRRRPALEVLRCELEARIDRERGAEAIGGCGGRRARRGIIESPSNITNVNPSATQPFRPNIHFSAIRGGSSPSRRGATGTAAPSPARYPRSFRL